MKTSILIVMLAAVIACCFAQENKRRVVAKPKAQVELSCEVPAGMQFDGWTWQGRGIRWDKNISQGSKRSASGNQIETIEIKEFEADLAGDYICSVRNNQGISSKSIITLATDSNGAGALAASLTATFFAIIVAKLL